MLRRYSPDPRPQPRSFLPSLHRNRIESRPQCIQDENNLDMPQSLMRSCTARSCKKRNCLQTSRRIRCGIGRLDSQHTSCSSLMSCHYIQ